MYVFQKPILSSVPLYVFFVERSSLIQEPILKLSTDIETKNILVIRNKPIMNLRVF